MRGSCMCREGVRETHRGWQWSCPLPRLAGGGSWPTAASPLKLGCRGTGAAWRPCTPSCPSLSRACPPLLGPAARLSPACCLVATLHGAAACSSSAGGGCISHDQRLVCRTTRADTIATTAACCGRSVAELRGRCQRFGWESKPTGLASALRKKWWLLSHLSSAPCWALQIVAHTPRSALACVPLSRSGGNLIPGCV